MNKYSLPKGFESLEPFVDSWAIPDSAGRDRRRTASTEEERMAFFDAASGLIQPALEALDKKNLDRLDESEQRLMNLVLTFAHIALAVEIQGSDEPRHVQYREIMKITRSPTDSRVSGP